MREIQERNGEMRGWKQTGKEGVNDRGVREMGTEREEGTEEKRTRYGGLHEGDRENKEHNVKVGVNSRRG